MKCPNRDRLTVCSRHSRCLALQSIAGSMKKCTWCGKEYPDEATACVIDAQPLVPVGLQSNSSRRISEQDPPAQAPENATCSAARKNMVTGSIWCVGGIAVTMLTYSSAAAAPGGGGYVVAWGAIVFGGWRFIRGMIAASAIEKHLASTESPTNLPSLGEQTPTPELWSCASCGEKSELHFTTCWKCRSPRDHSTS